jgi:hypothetical protein
MYVRDKESKFYKLFTIIMIITIIIIISVSVLVLFGTSWVLIFA